MGRSFACLRQSVKRLDLFLGLNVCLAD